MAISIKHNFVSTKPATPNPKDVDGPKWNEDHVITLGASTILGRYSLTDGDAQEITLGSGLSLDDSTGVLSASATGNYLPLTGGTLTGHLTISDSYQVKWSDVGLERGSAGVLKITDASTGTGNLKVAEITTDENDPTVFTGLDNHLHLRPNDSSNNGVILKAGQNGYKSIQFGGNANAGGPSHGIAMFHNNYGFITRAHIGYNWSSSTSHVHPQTGHPGAQATIDTGLKRDSAAVVKVTNGGSGKGNIIVAEPTAGDHAATKDYVDNNSGGGSSAPVTFDTKAELEAATVAAGYDAVWIMGYSAAGDGGGAKYKRVGSEPSHAGKIQDAGGTWFELAENHINVRMFGAYGDWSSSNQRDDTQAFQDAIDYVQTFPGGSDGFPMGYQGHVVYVPAGKYGITDTLDNTNARGFLSIIGDSQEASIIVWNKTTAGNIPFLDHGAKGENARFEDIRTYVPVGATLPSTWIKTTTFIDHGFSVKGAYFYNAEDSIIECAGALNANLHNWRCEGTNNTIIKVTDAGDQARTASIENFTLHAREASNGAEVVSDLNSFIDITLTTSNKKHFVWKNCSFELDTDAVASTFNFMVLRGNSTRHPAIITTFDGVGIFEQTTTATPTINLFNGAGTSVHTAHVFRNFEMNALDNFATGNLEITSQGIPAARFINKWVVEAKFSSTDQVTWHAGSGDVATQQIDITGSTTVDARDLHGTLIQLTATAASDLATISNARPGQIIHLVRAGASSAVTIKHNTGNINLSGGDLTLSNVRILTLRYDSLQTRWVGNKGL